MTNTKTQANPKIEVQNPHVVYYYHDGAMILGSCHDFTQTTRTTPVIDYVETNGFVVFSTESDSTICYKIKDTPENSSVIAALKEAVRNKKVIANLTEELEKTRNINRTAIGTAIALAIALTYQTFHGNQESNTNDTVGCDEVSEVASQNM